MKLTDPSYFVGYLFSDGKRAPIAAFLLLSDAIRFMEDCNSAHRKHYVFDRRGNLIDV